METGYQLSDLFDPILKQNPNELRLRLQNLKKEAQNELSFSPLSPRDIPQDKYGCTPLFWGIKLGNPEMVSLLLDAGFSPLDYNRDHSLAWSAILEKRSDEIFKLCMNRIQSYHEPIPLSRDSAGSSFLHKLIHAGEENWVIELVDYLHSDILKVFDSDQYAPIHLAIRVGSLTITEKLAKMNPDLLVLKNSLGLNPILVGVEYNREEILNHLSVKYSAEFGEAIRSLDNNQNSAVHIGVESEAVELLPLLFSYRLPLLEKNSDGESPFQIAYREKYHHCTRLLKNQLIQELKSLKNEDQNKFEKLFISAKNEKILSSDDLYQISPDLLGKDA